MVQPNFDRLSGAFARLVSLGSATRAGSDEEWSRVGFGVVGVMHHRVSEALPTGPERGPGTPLAPDEGGLC